MRAPVACERCAEVFQPGRFGNLPRFCPGCRVAHHRERTRLYNREVRGNRDKATLLSCEDCGSGIEQHRVGGVRRFCETCRERRRRAYLARAYRRHNLKKSYGLTESGHAELVATHGGRCDICSEADVRLVIDHDHASGMLRGVLCSNCNTALGLLRDDPQRIRAALDYLAGGMLRAV